MYTTFGAPSGALGGSKGVQSGTESRMSVLTTPLNGLPISAPASGAPGQREQRAMSPDAGPSSSATPPPARMRVRNDPRRQAEPRRDGGSAEDMVHLIPLGGCPRGVPG